MLIVDFKQNIVPISRNDFQAKFVVGNFPVPIALTHWTNLCVWLHALICCAKWKKLLSFCSNDRSFSSHSFEDAFETVCVEHEFFSIFVSQVCVFLVQVFTLIWKFLLRMLGHTWVDFAKVLISFFSEKNWECSILWGHNNFFSFRGEMFSVESSTVESSDELKESMCVVSFLMQADLYRFDFLSRS